MPETIEGVAELAVPIGADLQAKIKLLSTSKQARVEHLVEWMLTTKDVRVAELLLRACGDLVPVQLLQQNNFQTKVPTSEAEAFMQVISNGRGPNEWKPPPLPEEAAVDPVLDAPMDTTPIPVPEQDDLADIEAFLENV